MQKVAKKVKTKRNLGVKCSWIYFDIVLLLFIHKVSQRQKTLKIFITFQNPGPVRQCWVLVGDHGCG